MQGDESIPSSQPPVDQSESAPADEQSEEENDESIPPSQPPVEQSESSHQSVEAPKTDSPMKQASAKASPIKSQAEVINGHNGVHNEPSESKNEAEHNDSDNKVEPLEDHN